ncbi:hypothetical protein J2W42_005066 [Rhizobium tibeticum]|uniref:hypothetical protein n=1 Tax=Rhizobium tibeticum TaxID=501024 RepID=UPI0027819B10|nr:hypothetical protein [Rhizobium tibeticum]MDP9812196.1 hypothetical protein [Rhizobium tibeticum]
MLAAQQMLVFGPNAFSTFAADSSSTLFAPGRNAPGSLPLIYSFVAAHVGHA